MKEGDELLGGPCPTSAGILRAQGPRESKGMALLFRGVNTMHTENEVFNKKNLKDSSFGAQTQEDAVITL